MYIAITWTTIMMRLFYVALLVISITSGFARSQSTPAPSVSITLSAPQVRVKIGAEIWVDAVTSNISDHRLRIGFLPGPYESEDLTVIVQVRDSQDRPVGPEKIDQHACEGEPNCRILFTESRYLGPGQSAKDHFLIDSKKYDLSHPGTYTIQIVRQDMATREIVKSNLLTITVTQ
jgi:hypothetical protein